MMLTTYQPLYAASYPDLFRVVFSEIMSTMTSNVPLLLYKKFFDAVEVIMKEENSQLRDLVDLDELIDVLEALEDDKDEKVSTRSLELKALLISDS